MLVKEFVYPGPSIEKNGVQAVPGMTMSSKVRGEQNAEEGAIGRARKPVGSSCLSVSSILFPF
jgi:hypothetical protein